MEVVTEVWRGGYGSFGRRWRLSFVIAVEKLGARQWRERRCGGTKGKRGGVSMVRSVKEMEEENEDPLLFCSREEILDCHGVSTSSDVVEKVE